MAEVFFSGSAYARQAHILVGYAGDRDVYTYSTRRLIPIHAASLHYNVPFAAIDFQGF